MRTDATQADGRDMKPRLVIPQNDIGSQRLPMAPMNAKLHAALEYLGDRLATHHASRFKPARRALLDEWLAVRLTGREGIVAPQRESGRIQRGAGPVFTPDVEAVR